MQRFHHHKTTWPKRILLTLIVAVGFGGLLNIATAQGNDAKPSLQMKAVPSKVYQGESFQLAVTLDNAFTETPPNMDYLQGEFDLDYLGGRPRNSSIRITVNNVTQTREEKGVTFYYRLTPKNAGTIRIESPEVSAGGENLTAPPVTVEVIAPSDQDLTFLEMATSVDSVYPLTPFDVTFSVFVKELPGKFADEDPVLAISRQGAIPSLTVPWGQDDGLPTGIIPVADWQRWVTGYQNNDGGFSINHLRFEDPFDLGWAFGNSQRNEATFFIKPTRTERTDRDGNPVNYWRYDFRRTFTSEAAGPIDFDAVVLKGTFITSGEDGKLKPEEVYVISKPLTVQVKDVPADGRPNDYVGAFGQFRLNVDLNPDKVKVGEAMTLIMTLRGKGSVLNVKPPKLEEIPAIVDRFRVYPPSEETEDGQVRWTWSLRPLTEGVIPFPPLSVSYFDVGAESFVTLKSDEIPLTVEKNDAPNSAGLFAADTPRSAVSVGTMRRSESGIFENRNTPPSGRRSLTLRNWGLGVTSLYGATLLIWGVAGLWRRKKDSARTRLLCQIQEGNRLLADGWKLADLEGREKVSAECRRTMRAFLLPVADRFTVRIDAVSRSQLDEFLDRLAQDGPESPESRKTIEEFREFAARLERIQYGFEEADSAIGQEVRLLYDHWGRLLTGLGPVESSSRKRSREKSFSVWGGFLILTGALSLFGGCSGDADRDVARQFEEAIRLFEEADTGSAETPGLITASVNPGPAGEETDRSVSSSPSDIPSDKTAGSVSSDITPSNMIPSDKSESFRKVAALYEGLLQRGIETGPILYNQGNAFMRAGDTPRALASWRRAEKHLPGDPYLKANIETLRPTAVKKPLTETILFWQNTLSWRMKGILSFLLALLTCVGFLCLTLGRFSKRPTRGIRRGTVLSFLLFLVFSGSLYYDHRRFDLGNHGILTTESGIVRKGGSAQYEPLFRDPLPKLTEFIVTEKRSGWLRVRFSDGQTGWLPESDVLVY